MVSFSSAAEAVASAAAMQRSIARLARRDPSVGLSLRAGISIGEATLEDGDWFGTPVVEAARLCAAARPGQILVNDLVPAIIRAAGGSDFEPVGPVNLKGLPEPVTRELGALGRARRFSPASARSARHVEAVRVRRPVG